MHPLHLQPSLLQLPWDLQELSLYIVQLEEDAPRTFSDDRLQDPTDSEKRDQCLIPLRLIFHLSASEYR